MSEFDVSFTGHREVDEAVATASIDQLLAELHPATAVVGGAAGADTLAAQRCWALGIPYVMALPHADYPKHYGLDVIPEWCETFVRAERVVYVVEGKPWHFGYNFKRNEWMVDRSGLLISISTFDPQGEIPAKGGTAHCVRYAVKVGREVRWARCEEGGAE